MLTRLQFAKAFCDDFHDFCLVRGLDPRERTSLERFVALEWKSPELPAPAGDREHARSPFD